YYWGYSVKAAPQTLSEIMRLNRFDLAIATSKYGKPIASIRDSLKSRWEKARRTVITFGAPNRGLYEILREEGIDVEDTFDIVINTVGDQGTETLRCEEAVLASLAVLNFTAES
ncbi:MAG: putative RNA uridine N3 methyltransferase, partial [Candidatus Bathyarchaeia archaeon]